MSDFAVSWTLSRQRFLDEISGLSQAQLNWRIHPKALTMAEMAMHMAGVELSFGSQLSGIALDEDAQKVKLAATEGVVNDEPFPFAADEMTPEFVAHWLAQSRKVWEPVITAASPETRAKDLKSALGPMISGEGAFARLGFHSAYHQGQAYLIKNAPGFPVA